MDWEVVSASAHGHPLLYAKRDFQQYDLQVSAKTDVHFGG